MVEHAEQLAEFLEPIIASPEAGADLEHGAGVFTGNHAPIFRAESVPAKPPLEAFCCAESLHKLGQASNGIRVGCHEFRNSSHDVARGHEGRKKTKAAMKREVASAVPRAVQDVVDNQADIMQKLKACRRSQDLS